MTYRGCRIIAAGCAARIDGQFRLARDALPFRLPLDLNRHFALRMAGLHHAVCNLGTRAGQIGIDLASSFNTDAMPVWIAFTTALEADCTALTTHPSHAAWACTGIHSRAAAVKDAMDARFFIEISVLSDPSCRVAL